MKKISSSKERLDLLLVQRGLVETRQKARAAVLAGQVRVEGETVTAAGKRFRVDVGIELAPRPRYVSRGGQKLEGAWQDLGFPVADRVALDGGASTGGFTDFLLQQGARLVHAVDVGYGQLAWKLRQDPRVHVYERCNLRHLEARSLEPPPTLAVVDCSFISLAKVLPATIAQLDRPACIVPLVKPQFEAGKKHVGRRGVIWDPVVHGDVLRRIIIEVQTLGLTLLGGTTSPLLGPKGNAEFFLHLSLPETGDHEPQAGTDTERASIDHGADALVTKLVDRAHALQKSRNSAKA